MNTQTAERTTTEPRQMESGESKGAVSIYEPRIKFPGRAFSDHYGYDAQQWKVMVEATWPSAQSAASVVMAIEYCRSRKLDPFKRVVHIVPMWSSQRRAMVETVWPGIAELRTTAARTGEYAGKDATAFSPDDIEEKFTGTSTGRNAETRERTVTYPEWAQVTLYRIVKGTRCAFVGPKVYWKESYGAWKGTDVPNDMWCERPYGQLEKCAEAAALRAAFPEEIGNDYAAEEMDGRAMVDVTPPGGQVPVEDGPNGGPPGPAKVKAAATNGNGHAQAEQKPVEQATAVEGEVIPPKKDKPQQTASAATPKGIVEAEATLPLDYENGTAEPSGQVEWGDDSEDPAPRTEARAPQQQEAGDTAPFGAEEFNQWLRDLDGAFSAIPLDHPERGSELAKVQAQMMAPNKSRATLEQWKSAERVALNWANAKPPEEPRQQATSGQPTAAAMTTGNQQPNGEASSNGNRRRITRRAPEQK